MKKHILILGVALVVVAGLAALAIHKYQQTPKGLTLAQAVSQRDNADRDNAILKAIDDNDQKAINNLTDTVNALNAQKATLCKQVTVARLSQPICK
jgi:hypothetical protein